MITYIVLAVIGLAIALVGTTAHINWLIPVGLVILIGAFFWFVRNRQGTPIMTKDDGMRR
jgi:cytochrome c-type biogenesis protein CcmH/NrfF